MKRWPTGRRAKPAIDSCFGTILRRLLPLLLALSLIRLWFMPLPSSFWLDEMATVFVAQHGSGHPSLADAAPQAWRSWYYPVIRMNGAVFGYSEVATPPAVHSGHARIPLAPGRPGAAADSSGSGLVCGLCLPGSAGLQLPGRQRAALRAGH